MHIRPASIDRDVPTLQALYGHVLSESPAEEYVRRIIHDFDIQIAETNAAETVGFRVITRRNTMPATQAFLWVVVAESYRRRGVGSQLLQNAVQQAETAGYTEFISQVDAENSAGLGFCARFGFVLHRHLCNLTLDIVNWERSALAPKLEQALASGVEFMTFGDFKNTPENQHQLYALNKALSATIPIDEPEDFPAFEPYAERRLSGAAFPHTGILLALEDDQWIGMSQVSLHDDHAFIEMTGVLPNYRGRGIAQALKHLSILFCEQNERKTVRTFNDVGNAPMLAVNKKVGFQVQNSWYFVRHQLSE